MDTILVRDSDYYANSARINYVCEVCFEQSLSKFELLDTGFTRLSNLPKFEKFVQNFPVAVHNINI